MDIPGKRDEPVFLILGQDDVVLKLEQEIETLRKQVGAETLANTILQKTSDEWKRRVKLAISWMTYAEGYGTAVGLGEVNDADLLSGFTSTYPEAANWFEEE